MLLHDPQTAGLVAPLRETGAKVTWRCHVGVDLANDVAREAWGFLLPHVREAEVYVFSRDAFVWDDLDRSRAVIIPPSIDAFSAKNQELPQSAVAAILRAAGLQDGSGRRGSRLSCATTGPRDGWTGTRTFTAASRSTRRSPRWSRSRAGTGSRTTQG